MNTATIVHVKPGHVAPEEYLKLVSSKCPTAFGFAGREKDGKLVCESVAREQTLSDLKELNEAFKDSHLLMFFANYPKAVFPDDIQPWSLNDGAEDPKHYLMMMFEGNFKNYENMNGDHTAEFCVSDEVVFPRLEKAANDVGGDIPKFLESLRQPAIQRTLCNSFDGRGVFIFLGETGDPISFGTNDVGGEFEWGSTSNAHGYTEKKAVTAQVKEAAQKGLSFLRGRTSSTAAITEPEPPPPPKPDAPHPDADTERKTVTTPEPEPMEKEEGGVKLTRMFPPSKLPVGSKARNLWLRTFNNGALPPNNGQSNCSVWVQPELIEFAKRECASKGDVEHLAGEIHTLRKAKAGADVSSGMKAAHETAEAAREVLVGKSDKPITRSTVREKAASPSDYLPVMSDPDKEKALGILSTYLDPRNEKRPSPVEIQSGERKWPTFSSTIGLKFEELLFVPVKTLTELFDGNKIAVAAFIEMRQRYIDGSGIKLEDLVLGSAKAEEKATAPKPAEKQTGGKLNFLRGKPKAA